MLGGGGGGGGGGGQGLREKEGERGRGRRRGRGRESDGGSITHLAWASSSYLFLISSSSDCVVSSADRNVLTFWSASASRASASEEEDCSSLCGEERERRERGSR